MAHTANGHKIGPQSISFCCEGFAVYVGYFEVINSYSGDLDSKKIHINLFTEDIITGPVYNFYSSSPLYPISGVFTRFITSKIGINMFKAIYAQQNIENDLYEKDFPLNELIAEFKTTPGTKRQKEK